MTDSSRGSLANEPGKQTFRGKKLSGVQKAENAEVLVAF